MVSVLRCEIGAFEEIPVIVVLGSRATRQGDGTGLHISGDVEGVGAGEGGGAAVFEHGNTAAGDAGGGTCEVGLAGRAAPDNDAVVDDVEQVGGTAAHQGGIEEEFAADFRLDAGCTGCRDPQW